MTYPGDVYFLVLPLSRADGATPAVAMPPLITIVNLQTGVAAVSPAPQMTLQSGMASTYVYRWDTSGLSNGTYLASVTYAVDGVAFTNQFLEKVSLGDSRIIGQVAQEATTAKELTVAKDATVLHNADFSFVDTSAVLQAILTKLSGVTSKDDLAAVAATLQDVRDAATGTWVVDKVAGTLTMRRPNGSALAVFNLINTSTHSSRNRV